MLESGTLTWGVFLLASGLMLLLFLLVGAGPNRLEARFRALAARGRKSQADPVANFAMQALPMMGNALLPKNEEERTRLQTRLIHAGLYSRQAMAIFFGIKVCLMMGPAFLGLLAG